MKKKLIEILEKNLDYKPHTIIGIEKCAEEILLMAEFEALCNPDIYEASANEHFEQEEKRELLMRFRDYYFLVGCGIICESDIDRFLDETIPE